MNNFQSPRPNLDAERRKFAHKGRGQLPDFLTPTATASLAKALAAIEWRLVFNLGERHVDLSGTDQTTLGPEKLGVIVAEATARAQSSFQYLYENYPIADLAAAGHLKIPGLRTIFAQLNSPETCALIEQVTGEKVDFCDMQATKYSGGHFLTPHDDAVAEKNRKIAYVLSLSPNWQQSWGGNLQFLSDSGELEEEFVPRFNTISLFKIPVPHQVSPVSLLTPRPRYSLTGWFRTKD
ncbi:MAG: 2OG-Fe(II) oxygenase family protein [Parvularculaceae bacterium]